MYLTDRSMFSIGQLYAADAEPPKLIATAPGANDDVVDVQEDDPSKYRKIVLKRAL